MRTHDTSHQADYCMGKMQYCLKVLKSVKAILPFTTQQEYAAMLATCVTPYVMHRLPCLCLLLHHRICIARRPHCLHTSAACFQAYVCQLGSCLVELNDNDIDGPITQKLRQWGRECDALIVGTAFSSPGNLKQLYEAKMDEGKVYPEHRHSESWLRGLLVGWLHVLQTAAVCLAALWLSHIMARVPPALSTSSLP